ncbi:MAG: tetratricopeptide repeat protein [Proteobacteria bacterium]|nr:MAG: tetratricopeptide repeat protein [Pseudomonadota bacterium]
MHTAATISSRYLEDDARALEFYGKVLESDATNVKAAEEAAELYKKVGNYDASERMLQTVLDLAKDAGDRDRMVVVLDELADLYRRFLKEPELAIDALEAAQAFDPEGKDRSEMLAELYASDPAQYLEKAVRSQAQLLQNNPYRVESYKLLRKLYTDTKHADPAWCLCQALATLNLAEPDEERFYTRYRSKTAAPAQAVLDDSDWDHLLHPDADPVLTKLFALLEPVIRKSRTQPIEQLGFDQRYAIDTSQHPYPVSQTLYYAQGVLGLGQVKVFQQLADAPATQAAQFVGFVHASEPAIVIGRTAFETPLEAQALTFILGRHLSYYRAGHYVRHLVPSGTGLKAWLFAGIKLCVPNFPVAADLQGPVAEATQHLVANLTPNDKDNLASIVSRLLREAPALDLKKWVAGIDFSADRTGFLLAHDLDTSASVIRDNPLGEAGLPTKERMKELVLFGVSESYFALRKSLSVAIDS